MALDRSEGKQPNVRNRPRDHARGRGRRQTGLTATNPATGEVIGHVPVTPVDEVPALYERARIAQRPWGARSVRERVRRLRRLRFTVADRVEDIARRVSESTGKTEAETLITELLLVLSALQYVEKHAPRMLRRRRKPTPIFLAGKSSFIEYMPKGVVLVIAPWNFPLQLALVPVIYALAAGNAVILKPSEVTPMVGVLMEDLIEQAGFPPDLVQVAHGAGELGAALVTPPDGVAPDHIFFTGSVRTGQIIQRAAADRLIPTTLELSGKDAMIVFADAPMERAVNGAVWGGFMNSGQVCVGVERLYVERSIHDEFVQRLAAETARLRQGGAGADLGSMTFPAQVDIVREHVRDAVERGAALVYGGGFVQSMDGAPVPAHQNRDEPSDSPGGGRNMFIPPIIIGNVTRDMRIAGEETFGPVLTVIPFGSEQEAIEAVNGSAFGLSASVWTRDRERGRRVASQIKAGGVAVNDVIAPLANQHLPFGGIKQSGLGGNHGETGLKTFSHEKAVMGDWLGRKRDPHWFPYEGKAPLFARLLRSYFRERRSWTGFLGAFVGLLRRSR